MVALAQQVNMWVKPVEVERGDLWLLGKHRLYCGDSTNPQDVARLMQGDQADLIFADPPYGIGIDTWDVAIKNVPAFIALVTANLKQGGFFAFTHQMPYMVEWLHVLQGSELRYKDHIAWVKRVSSSPMHPLLRSHESLFIYSYGSSSYHTTTGKYADVKVPGVLFDVVSIQGIGRYISDLEHKIKHGSGSMRNHSQSHNKAYNHIYMVEPRDHSPEFVNFTNVWSFVPEHRKKGIHNTGHATAKPVLLLERLLVLCSGDNALIYDAFLGSGTTLLSAEHTGRTCYGMELSPEYCSVAIQRWQETTGERAVKY